MNEVGVEIVKTEETEKNEIKYLNINVSNSEVERKPDIVRLCADADILEYVKPSGDAISRQAVIGLIADYDLSMEQVVKGIFALSPVKPQPKLGHWKRISIDKYSEHAKYWYRCDRCGKDNLGNTDWCPNCGAKMQEVEE